MVARQPAARGLHALPVQLPGFAETTPTRLLLPSQLFSEIASLLHEYSSDLMGVLVMLDTPRNRYWGHARTALVEADMMVEQDADGEGAATSPQMIRTRVRFPVQQS